MVARQRFQWWLLPSARISGQSAFWHCALQLLFGLAYQDAGVKVWECAIICEDAALFCGADPGTVRDRRFLAGGQPFHQNSRGVQLSFGIFLMRVPSSCEVEVETRFESRTS